MARTTAETKQAFRDAPRQFVALRTKWPKAFPAKSHEVRPLAVGVVPVIAAAFDWTPAYARGIMTAWKMRNAYCRAILAHTIRINLDGSETGELVNEAARAVARETLAKRDERQRREAAKAEKRQTAALPNGQLSSVG